MAAGTRRVFPNSFAVNLTDEGNLVLEHLQNGPYWDTGTAGLGVTQMVMQDGVLSLLNEEGAVWESTNIYQLDTGSLLFSSGVLGVAKPDSGLTWSSSWWEE